MMRNIFMLTLIIGLASTSQQLLAEIYQDKDEHGQTIFTDTPTSPDAKPVKVNPIMTYTPSVKPQPEAKEVLQDPSVGAYETLRITSPQQQGTVRDNQGIVRVRFESVPPMLKDDRAVLYLDGQKRESFDVKGIERGEHHVQVAIEDINGTEKIRSDLVTFYLHHQSRLFNN